jgi:outer membrane protein assembly factor BamB
VKLALIAALVGVVLALGIAIAFVLYKRHQSRDIRGSSTVEFVPTEPPPKPPMPAPPPKPKPGRPRKPAALTRIDWPTFGYDSRRLRYLPTRLEPPFRVAWRFRARHLLEFPPAVAYGRVYIASNEGVLYAVQAATGRVSWRYRSDRCAAASPAVADEVVYMSFLNRPPCNRKATDRGIDGEVVALDARKGRVRWRVRIGPSESSPAVVDGLVYVGDWRGRVYALDAKTGRERWRFQTGGEVKGAVTVSGRRLYVGSYDHYVYALNARTGRPFWRAGAQLRLGNRGTFYSTPAAAYARVYIGSTDGKVYSFGATSGKVRWSQSTGGYVYASPAIWRDRVFIGSYGKKFMALDAATGDVLWEFKVKDAISGSPVVLGKLVYFSTTPKQGKGRTFALDARTGKQVWSFPDGKYATVVASPERLYLAGYTRLYALEPR